MNTLILLRHAKSLRENLEQPDFDRPLTQRGERDAARMGAWLAREGYSPQLVLCSAAARTQATLALIKPMLPRSTKFKILKALYLATPANLLRSLQKTPAEIQQLLIIGHNPGLEELALLLATAAANATTQSELAAMRAKFPTAAAAVLSFATSTWQDVQASGGQLANFMTPKRLPATADN
jgi:phosphohistidine phosphatase